MPRPSVVVLGSVHMDLIATAARLPAHGESVTGGTFAMAPGGKGGNQARQFARAGARSAMLTRLGDDLFGHQLLAVLRERGVDTSLVAVDPDNPTGASTVLAGEGDYASIIAPGAAALLSTADVDRARPAIAAADALVLQFELPLAISAYAAGIAGAAGRAVILNASPVPDDLSAVPGAIWRAATVLVVNRVEAGRLLGRNIAPEDVEGAAASLSATFGAGTVAITLGGNGAGAWRDGQFVFQPGFPATVVDTVGAGDAFLGTFATALLAAAPLDAALRRGAAAGAIAVSRRGVDAALPSREEVDAFLSGAGSQAS